MKPLLLVTLAGVGVGFGLGLLVPRSGSPAAVPGGGAAVGRVPDPPPSGAATGAVVKADRGGPTAVVGAGGTPRLKALLAAFDRRKPVESQLAVLKRIMAASPAELAELAGEMAGPRRGRNDPGWWQTRTAVLQRWVELAPDEAIAWAKAAQKRGDDSHQAAEVFGILANADPTRAMAEAQRLTNPMLRNNAVQSVIGSLSQSDPEQAFRLCQSLPSDQRRNTYYAVFSSWAERDPAAAAATLLTLKDRQEQGQASWSLMNRWAAQDPAAALAWAKGLGESGMRQGALQSYFSTLGQRDPEAAIAQISEFPRSQQHGFLSNVVSNWVRMDPDAATAWVLARPNAVDKQQLIAAAVGNLGWMAGEQASKLVTQLAPGSAREQALRQVIDQWMWSDPESAVSFAATLPAAEQLRLREQVAQGLAYRDPEKALSYLKDNPIDDPASEIWGRLAGTMASMSSPEKAIEWANALPDEISRRKALPGIFSQMVQENPAEAAKQAGLVVDEATRLECLANVAGAWAGAGMEDALAWAQGLAGKDREAAMGAVLAQGAPHQPTVAAEQFDSLMAAVPAGTKPADGLLNAAATIAGAYFAENEQAAAAWASSLPQEDARAAALRSLAQQWAQYDPAGASEWIGTLPGGKPRDAAVGQLVGRIAPSDPATAFAWAATVADSGDRSNLLESTFASWRKLDVPAARSAIEAADWPDDEKSRWLDKVK